MGKINDNAYLNALIDINTYINEIGNGNPVIQRIIDGVIKKKLPFRYFAIGEKVIVNTGGEDGLAIIDWPTIRKDNNGKYLPYYKDEKESVVYLCRFTNQLGKTWIGGANAHSLHRSSRYIDMKYIRRVSK